MNGSSTTLSRSATSSTPLVSPLAPASSYFRNFRLLETNLPFGKPGFVKWRERKFNDTLKLTRRYYPHVYNMDGFYVAKLKKFVFLPFNANLRFDLFCI